MGLFIQQNDSRSKLQERIETELREKAKRQAELDPNLPDGVEDSMYIKGTKRTTSYAWIWFIVIAAAIVAIIWLVVAGTHTTGSSL